MNTKREAEMVGDMHYYQFNIGDYRRKTGYLTVLEHGVYRLLIDTYYLSEKPLTSNKAKLMRTHNIRTADEERALDNVLDDFFELKEDGYHHAHCDEIISKYQEKSEKARQAALIRWSDDANAMQSHSESNADGMPTINHKPITNNQEPEVHSQTPAESDPFKLSNEKRESVPFSDIAALWNKMMSPDLPACEKLTKTRKGYIRQRWLEELDTLKKWENFFDFIKQSDFLMGRVPGRNGGRPFRATLEWVTKESNYAKIYEDQYHG